MPNLCRVCTHPNRPDIDRALAREPALRVAKRYSITRESIYAHRENHCEKMQIEIPRNEPRKSLDMVAEVEWLLAQAKRLAKVAEEAGDTGVIGAPSGYLAQVGKTLELITSRLPRPDPAQELKDASDEELEQRYQWLKAKVFGP